ncbi:MAG: GntR family transcriptional regulator [Chloroflexi bacterium]|nr:GntR family transcriptional regulator [Chloroflexota bacterium]
MNIHLQRVKVPTPLNKQVYEQLLECIRDGLFAVGQKLPSEITLARDLGVSRASLREALQQLELEGYIARKRGMGTFVIGPQPFSTDAGVEKLHSVTQIIVSHGWTPGTSECELKFEPADENTAKKLGILVGDPTSVISRVRTANNRPFCYDISRFPVNFLPHITDPVEIGESLLKYVEERLGFYINHAIARLIPMQSDVVLSRKLDIPEGTLIMCLDQVHFMADNTPVWYAQVYFPKDVITWHIVRTR